ncbi:MAG TPA: sporulation protein YqfD [Firmicutes bacterium]|nr:sporulation protein YqfD [Bacillota bacterium]
MFIIRLLRFLLGYAKFEATGVFCERFINLCSYNGIKIWGIIKKQEKIVAYILARDYKKLRRISKKTSMRPRVVGRYGLPFILRKFRARSGLFAGAVVAAVLIYTLSLSVWNIQIEGNNRVETAEIQSVLKNLGMTEGVRRDDIDTEKIRHELLLSMPELSWAAINLNGTSAVIEVSEAEPTDTNKDDTPCNIVAKSDGRIVSIDVYKGLSNVKEGDAVVKGDLLISGVVDHLNGTASFLRASGSVLAETESEISVRVDYNQIKRVRTGKVKTKRVLTFLGMEIPLYLSTEKDEYELELSSWTMNIGGVNMPVKINTGKFYFVENVGVTLSEDEALNQARQQIEGMEKSRYQSAEILERQEFVQYDEKGLILTVKYLCRENIGVEENILINDTE